MADLDLTKQATIGHLKSLAEKTVTAIETAIADIPAEMFLDQTKTQFVGSFAFNASTYPGATNPNLDGKPVLVLAVKGIDHNNNDAVTTTFSFLNMATLVDTYKAATGNTAKIITINGYTITFNVSANANNAVEVLNDGIAVRVSTTANNAHTKDANGLYVRTNDKTDKVSGATAGNVASLDASGNLEDSGVKASKILTTDNVATDTEVNAMLAEVFGG